MEEFLTEAHGMNLTALAMEHISKRFPGTLAVDNVDFDVQAGEVHALMGENGAGKSTLMKTLTGCFDDYTGTIRINGQEALIHSPADAKDHGVGMVYQELSLARPISIAENLLAGRLPTNRWGVLDGKTMQREARQCLKSIGLDIDPNMITHPRESSYVRTDGWDQEVEKWFAKN